MRLSSVQAMNDAIRSLSQQLETTNDLCQELDTLQRSKAAASPHKFAAAGVHQRRLLQDSSQSMQDSLDLLLSALNASSGFVINSTSFDNSTLDLQGVSRGRWCCTL